MFIRSFSKYLLSLSHVLGRYDAVRTRLVRSLMKCVIESGTQALNRVVCSLHGGTRWQNVNPKISFMLPYRRCCHCYFPPPDGIGGTSEDTRQRPRPSTHSLTPPSQVQSAGQPPAGICREAGSRACSVADRSQTSVKE